jgi:glucose-1-phosphate cytidylyltransferase
MDTLRDKVLLEKLWQSGNPPWMIWDEDALANQGQEQEQISDEDIANAFARYA